MKKTMVLLGLMSMSTLLYAVNCGDLGVTVINSSDYDCVLRNITVNNGGAFVQNVPAALIAKGADAPTFYVPQTISGVDIKLDYRCENKFVSFTSHQNLCFFAAGNIHGYAEVTNDLSLEQKSTMGSFLRARPGEITWTIH